ncbi:Saposin B-type domain-containing protein [Trichostrongylus colubriformis]|uniref:Saposin B-type domain-containing protein n=1 Tax=Trichostrongylus colubriformis TaxID=6319 RepID=A0AAN8FBJ5_TRICO
MTVLRALLILSLAVFVSVKTLSAETECNSCKVIIGDVKAVATGATESLEVFLRETVKNVCQRYVTIKPLEEVCEIVEQKLLHALFEWIEKKEGQIDPDVDCQYIRLCPRPKGFETFLRMLKVPDVPPLQ